MSDYSFMKTGFDPVGDNVSEEETKKNAISLIVAFSEGALITAAKYVSHGNRKDVTPEDLKRAMMLEMFLFKHRDDTLEKAQKIKDELFGDEEEDEDEEFVEDDDESQEFTENTCDCALCKCINGIYTRWDNFQPSTPFEAIFQKHIDNMC